MLILRDVLVGFMVVINVMVIICVLLNVVLRKKEIKVYVYLNFILV